METKNIMIVGVGGQGTLLTSRILGALFIQENLDVKLSEVHGMAQRGGSVVTFVRFGKKVHEPIVEEGCADILLSFERLEALRYLHYLKEDGILIVNDQRIDPMGVITEKEEYPENIFEELKKHRHFYPVDALAMAKELGNVKVFNTIILGLLSRFLEFSEESWLKVIRETVPKKTIETNIKAFLWGRKGEQI